MIFHGKNRPSFLPQLQWASSEESLSALAIEANPSVKKKNLTNEISINRHNMTGSSQAHETAPHAHAAPSGGGVVFGLFSRKFPTSAGGDPSAGPAMSLSQSSASPGGENNQMPNSVL